MTICKVTDCGKKVKSHKLCSMHLCRLQRHGDVNYKVHTTPSTPEKINAYIKTPRGKLARLRANARRRSIPVTLTLEQYAELMSRPCHYCEEPLASNGGGNLDRVDSSKGYTIENSATCCRTCNIAKNTLSYSDFITHVLKIAKVINERFS